MKKPIANYICNRFQSDAIETFSLSLAINNVEWGTRKIKAFAEAIFKVSRIGEMSEGGVIAEKDKSRWVHANLRSKHYL